MTPVSVCRTSRHHPLLRTHRCGGYLGGQNKLLYKKVKMFKYMEAHRGEEYDIDMHINTIRTLKVIKRWKEMQHFTSEKEDFHLYNHSFINFFH